MQKFITLISRKTTQRQLICIEHILHVAETKKGCNVLVWNPTKKKSPKNIKVRESLLCIKELIDPPTLTEANNKATLTDDLMLDLPCHFGKNVESITIFNTLENPCVINYANDTPHTNTNLENLLSELQA